MATKKITVLYNSSSSLSLLALMIMKIRFILDTFTPLDMLGLTETTMDTAIDTVSDATQDRVYCVAETVASGNTPGKPSIDQNIVNAKTKLKATPDTGYEDVMLLGDVITTQTAPTLAWIDAYGTLSWPAVVRYMGGKYFPVIATANATSIASDGVNDTGNFTASAHIGQYVYIISTTTHVGEGEVHEILSNTTGKLVIAGWGTQPTGTVTYGIVSLKDEAFRYEALDEYIKGKLFNISDRATLAAYYKLLDMGTGDPSYNSINSGNLMAPITSQPFLEDIIAIGKDIYFAKQRILYIATL